ncbi:MAG: TetR/AcrR family transcriptional regulator, partial [Lentihominibacter sp.]
KGFDNTSTSDILDEIGIARGTLYYHFSSKEAILDGVIARMTSRQMAEAGKIVRNTELPFLERLTRAVLALNVESGIGHEVMEQIHRPQNALMHQKIQKKLLAGINPILTELMEEGVRDGICHTEYPAEAVEMIMLYANTAFDDIDMAGLSQEEKEQKISGFIYNVERLMGMERGSLQDAIMRIFHRDNTQRK